MTTSSALPAIFMSKLWVESSSFSFFESFFFFQLKLLNVFDQHFLNLFLSLLALISHFFHLLLEILRLLLIKLCNFFLSKHAAINCKTFLLWSNNSYCIRISFKDAIWLLNESFLELESYFFNLIKNGIKFLTDLTWAPILILLICFYNLIFTEFKHFFDL